MSVRRRSGVLRSGFAALVALAAMPACSGAPRESAPDDSARPWYIARFGAERDWTLEAQTPIEVQERPGMLLYERTRFPTGEATPAQQGAARALREASFLAAVQRGWFDYARGRADGFSLVAGDEAHYVNEEYLNDDALLDPERPEFLMYYDTDRGSKALVGFMYYVRAPEERGPQIGGPLTVWHFHMWSAARCFDGVVPTGRPFSAGRCAQGEATHRSPEMLHVWLLDHPEGPFATRMRIRPDVLASLLAKRGAG